MKTLVSRGAFNKEVIVVRLIRGLSVFVNRTSYDNFMFFQRVAIFRETSEYPSNHFDVSVCFEERGIQQ